MCNIENVCTFRVSDVYKCVGIPTALQLLTKERWQPPTLQAFSQVPPSLLGIWRQRRSVFALGSHLSPLLVAPKSGLLKAGSHICVRGWRGVLCPIVTACGERTDWHYPSGSPNLPGPAPLSDEGELQVQRALPSYGALAASPVVCPSVQVAAVLRPDTRHHWSAHCADHICEGRCPSSGKSIIWLGAVICPFEFSSLTAFCQRVGLSAFGSNQRCANFKDVLSSRCWMP